MEVLAGNAIAFAVIIVCVIVCTQNNKHSCSGYM